MDLFLICFSLPPFLSHPERRCWALWLVTAPFPRSNCQRDSPRPASLCAISRLPGPDYLALTGRFSIICGQGRGHLRTTDTWSCPKRGDGVGHWLFLPILHYPPTHTHPSDSIELQGLRATASISFSSCICFVLFCSALFCFVLLCFVWVFLATQATLLWPQLFWLIVPSLET